VVINTVNPIFGAVAFRRKFALGIANSGNTIPLMKALLQRFFFQIPDQDAARRAKPGDPFTFTVDAAKSGWGEVAIDVVFDNKSIRREDARISRQKHCSRILLFQLFADFFPS
jgi:hypothetical protein